MRNYNQLLSLASLLLSSSSVDAFASMKRTAAALSNTAIRAEVGGMSSADIPTVPGIIPEVAAPDVAAAAVSETASLSTDTAAKIIQSQQFAPPTAVQKVVIDPDGPQPLPQNPVVDLDTIALVVGQENYGFAVVVLGEAIWSFSKAPSIDTV